MSTVLTNGVIIPDNGSRNWGGDLANNWNILDVNVGYMNDVKNSVTTLENSVAENTANIQNNTSNISALQTSKQDTLSDQQIANIADVTNKANDADVVHKTGDETISGLKTWKSYQTISGTYLNNEFSTNARTCLYLTSNRDGIGQSGIYVSKFRQNRAQGEMSDGDNQILSIDVLENGVRSNSIFRFTFKGWVNDVPTRVYFEASNSDRQVFLGTLSNPWTGVYTKTLNDINPGALSLPNCAEGVDVTSQVVNTDGILRYTNNLYDGWLVVTAFADTFHIANQSFECRAVRSADDVVTAHMPLRLNETASMRFANFTKFAYVKLFNALGNV